MKPIHIVITVVIVSIIGVSSAIILGKDNPVEEIAEDIIKKETGIDVDLTVDSAEKK